MEEILATFRPDLFAGKRVLISGGTSGIGLCLAKAFARLGADVTATGASRGRLEAARADAEAKAVRFEQLDVRDRKAVDAFVGAFDRLDVLVNARRRRKAGGGIRRRRLPRRDGRQSQQRHAPVDGCAAAARPHRRARSSISPPC